MDRVCGLFDLRRICSLLAGQPAASLPIMPVVLNELAEGCSV